MNSDSQCSQTALKKKLNKQAADGMADQNWFFR